MIRIAIIGSIGSGKTFISKLFGYPVFNADKVVTSIYSKNKKIYNELKKKIPEYFFKFPIKKKELINVILKKKTNLRKITSIVHPHVKQKLRKFLIINKKKKIVILDIPLFLENKLNKKNDIIIFIQSNKEKTLNKIKKRKNFNMSIFKKFQSLQFKQAYKRKKSDYIIYNNFNKIIAQKRVKDILRQIKK